MKLRFFTYLIILLLLSPSCALIKAKSVGDIEISNYDETKSEVEETEIFYSSLDKDARGEGFIKIEEPTFGVQRFKDVIIKVERPGFLAQYYYVPKMTNKLQFVDYGISAGFVGLAAVYFANMSNIGDEYAAILGGGVALGLGIAGSLTYLRSGLVYGSINVESLEIPSEHTPFPKKTEDDKYMFLNDIEFDVESFTEKTYKSIEHFEGNSPYNTRTEHEELKDNFPVSNVLNKFLYDQGFIDTVNLMPNSYNSVYLDLAIKDVVFHKIKKSEFTSIEFEIEWKIMDFLTKKEVFNYTTNYKSVLLFNKMDLMGEYIKNILTESFYIFKNAPEVLEYLKAEEDHPEEFDPINIKSTDVASTYGKAIVASVTVEVDEGHGSGFVISDDGYIITNLHVVGNSDKFNIIFNDETEHEAELVRVNRKHDLALLKIDADSLSSIKIQTDEFSPVNEVGNDVYVIGTPNDVKLGQSVSSGIISGTRNFNDLTYLQTDAKINSGNSGGPMVGENGVLIGIANAKLIGVGIEGIGFAIPSYVILDALNITVNKSNDSV
ncbi:MAG: trypsin-like peptidase domain-containing protein, partial [Brumimicrobium sp.]